MSVVLISCFSLPALGQDAEALSSETGPITWEGLTPAAHLAQADAFFDAGQPARALTHYERLLAEGQVSARMLYRMAILEENSGHIPRTLYYLSLLYEHYPDESTRGHIESLARQYELTGYESDDWDFSRQLLGRSRHLLIGAALLLLALITLAIWRRRRLRRPLRLLPLFWLGGVVSIGWYLNTRPLYGKVIVSQDQAALMSEPAAASELVVRVPAGTRLTVLGQQDVWLWVLDGQRQAYLNRYHAWHL